MNGLIANLSARSKFNKVHVLDDQGRPLCQAPVYAYRQLLGETTKTGSPRKQRYQIAPLIQHSFDEPTCKQCVFINRHRS